MENINIIATLFGTLITLLLSVVAYFIKQLHTDFKSMEKDLIEVKTMALIIKTEFKSDSALINQKLTYLERRVQLLEFQHLKNPENPKSYIVAADFYTSINRPDHALAMYQRVLDSQPENPGILLRMARFYLNYNKFEFLKMQSRPN